MRNDNFPHPVSDPEADGLPDTADDDSTAYDDVHSPRVADGPDPAPLPPDREDGPEGMGKYGDTPEEARIGESMDRRLAEELPDPALTEVSELASRSDTRPSPVSAEAYDPDPLGEELDAVPADTSLDTGAPVQPTRGPVSMYDTGPGGRDGLVGRIVEPDGGTGPDTEPDAIGYDAGAAGGGPTAEELAMHEVPER